MMDLKLEAAKKACSLVQENSTIGLGAGSTIAHLVELLSPKIRAGFPVSLLTSSAATEKLLQKAGIHTQRISTCKKIDQYFDGCDQVDRQLNALKSGGGIHTMEKLLASMAGEFILIGDESKLVDHFDNRHPVVLELLPQAEAYVPARLEQLLPLATCSYRSGDRQDGPVYTENGNLLLDLWPNEWPETAALNVLLKMITGVVETSIFYQLAGKAIMAGKSGVETITK